MNKKHQSTRAHSRSIHQPPASGQRPRSVTRQDVKIAVKELIDYHHAFEQFFSRHEQADWSWFYLCGQLSNLERKTIEPMVLALLGPVPNAVRDLQRFMSQSEWDTREPMIQLQAQVAAWMGEHDGIVVVDGSGFPKQGKHSVGVARQYCGHLGKIANCQEGIFLGYVSRRGYGFLDERLYVPQKWFDADHCLLRKACGLPESVRFQTEGELALDMLQEMNERRVIPFQWVAFDESFGKNPAFLHEIAALRKWYMAEVPSDTRVWERTPLVEEPGQGLMGHPRLYPRVRRSAPPPEEVRVLAANLPKTAWHSHLIHEGSKGPLTAEFAVLRVTPVHDRLPAIRQWLILRRSWGPQPELKFYLSNAPVNCPKAELIRVGGLRWPIETSFREAKGEVGMDHYEMRTWLGWHHHMLQTFMAHLFLMRLRLILKKNYLHLPFLRRGNWWHQLFPKKLGIPKMVCLRSTTISNEIIWPTALIANTISISAAPRLQKGPAAKRRSNIQNVVVM
jgi:SRSO17 transposase